MMDVILREEGEGENLRKWRTGERREEKKQVGKKGRRKGRERRKRERRYGRRSVWNVNK